MSIVFACGLLFLGCGSSPEPNAAPSAAHSEMDPALLTTANQIAVSRRGDWDRLSLTEQETFLKLNGNNIAKAKRYYEKLAESAP